MNHLICEMSQRSLQELLSGASEQPQGPDQRWGWEHLRLILLMMEFPGCSEDEQGRQRKGKMAWKGHLAEARAKPCLREPGPLEWQVAEPQYPPKSESLWDWEYIAFHLSLCSWPVQLR